MSTEPQNLAPLPENPTPQDFGFPENPTAANIRCWQQQELFLASLAEHGIIAQACAETGIQRPAHDRWDYMDVYGFKRRKQWALESALGVLEREVVRRGVEGIDKPIYWRGQRVDTIKEYSDNLLMFRAKKLDPSYRDNHQVNVDARQYVTQITINPPATDSTTSNIIDAQLQPQLDSTDSATDTDS